MRIQTFVRSRGAQLHVLQIAFYRVHEQGPPDYLVTKITGKLPGTSVVEDFFKNGMAWFNDLMAFANRENHLENRRTGSRAFSREEAQAILRKWRRQQEAYGFSSEREFMDGILQKEEKNAQKT